MSMVTYPAGAGADSIYSSTMPTGLFIRNPECTTTDESLFYSMKFVASGNTEDIDMAFYLTDHAESTSFREFFIPKDAYEQSGYCESEIPCDKEYCNI